MEKKPRTRLQKYARRFAVAAILCSTGVIVAVNQLPEVKDQRAAEAAAAATAQAAIDARKAAEDVQQVAADQAATKAKRDYTASLPLVGPDAIHRLAAIASQSDLGILPDQDHARFSGVGTVTATPSETLWNASYTRPLIPTVYYVEMSFGASGDFRCVVDANTHARFAKGMRVNVTGIVGGGQLAGTTAPGEQLPIGRDLIFGGDCGITPGSM